MQSISKGKHEEVFASDIIALSSEINMSYDLNCFIKLSTNKGRPVAFIKLYEVISTYKRDRALFE